MRCPVLALASSLLAACAAGQQPHPSSANCTTRFFAQQVDHFSWALPASGNLTYAQRYLVCRQYYQSGGPIFFYTGNEGDVTLYANATGLMWENAPMFGAILVFAEHRYYGSSWPEAQLAPGTAPMYLSSTQALADYAVLLRAIKEELGDPSAPAIAFGGSYGGILSAFFRTKYPGSVDGALAASAPLRAFPGQTPAWDSKQYYEVVSRTFSAAAGASDSCRSNIASLWAPFFADGATATGRALLSAAFRTCAPLATTDDTLALAFWIRGMLDVLAMGNYPYASSYMTGGAALLPAYPARAACEFLNAPIAPGNTSGLYAAVAAAVAVLGNVTGAAACNSIDPNPYSRPAFQYDGQWDYQRCTELQPDSFWFTSNGQTDAFWPAPFNASFTATHCAAAWGVTPSYEWLTTVYDLPTFGGASNIVFSNGLFDGWSGASLQVSPAVDRDLVVLNITEGAHHVDLFFTNAGDPPSITQTRTAEIAYIGKWVAAARAQRPLRARARTGEL